MRRDWLLLVLLCCLCCAVRFSSAHPARGVQRIYIGPVKCKVKNCQDRKHHGDVHLIYADGQDVRVTTTGSCVGNVSKCVSPKVSRDKRTVGWLEGRHRQFQWRHADPYFYGERLVLYRNRRILRVLKGQLPYIGNWFFWNGGKQVAVQSQNLHGPLVNELRDVATGRLMARISHFNVDKASPQWAQRLGDGS